MKTSLKNNSKLIFMSVIIIILIIIVVIVAVHFFGSDDTDDYDDVFESATSEDLSSETTLSGDSDYLVICTDDTRREIIYLCILDFRIYSGSVVVTPLDASTSCSKGTYASSFEYGGTSSLIEDVCEVRSCVIDRYFLIDKDGFYAIFDNIGSVSVYVEEPFTYEASDKNNSVEAGENDLNSEMLYTYFCLTVENDDGIDTITELICELANLYIASIDTDTYDTEDIFAEFINCVYTDFSISDFYDCSDDIEYIIENKVNFIPYSATEQ